MKFTASDYWLEPAMFYNETILIDKMERFVELSSGPYYLVIDNVSSVGLLLT